MQFLVLAQVPQGMPMEKVLPYVKPEAEKVWEYYAADIVRSSGKTARFDYDCMEKV